MRCRGRGPLCPGIDPHPELLGAWGLTADADGLRRFSDTCVEVFADFAVVKPQVAFFEALRLPQASRRWRTPSRRCAAEGVLVLADAKRGDIGSTMAAYAEAWCGDSPLAADAVTASPYLGFGSLDPLLDLAAASGRGVFVLAATSNPEGADVQVRRHGRPHRRAVDRRRCRGCQRRIARAGFGRRRRRRDALVASRSSARWPVPCLVPGVGAQGGRPEELRGFAGARPRSAAARGVAGDPARGTRRRRAARCCREDEGRGRLSVR